MGAREPQRRQGSLAHPHGIFCCDSVSLIDLRAARLLSKLRTLARSGTVCVPEGVFRELRRKTDKLAKTVEQWKKKYGFVVALDTRTLELLPDIERKYGPPFAVGGKTYPGFWASPSGKKSVDGQVVALAKARRWVAVSNDNSVHGACMLEDVECRRWEEIGRLLLGPEQPHLPGL